ncbi:MAG: glycosyltransferase [Propionivibrio sp.]
MHPDKDQATLIAGFAAALPELPPHTLLLIIGSGPLEGELRSLARTLGVGQRVRFMGQVPDARSLFRAFDLFVLTSDHEPFGMVLLEAMAAAVPVIATDCGGAPEVVGRKDCLVGLKDSDGLAALLRGFLVDRDASDRAEVGAASKSRLTSLFSDAAARGVFFSLAMAKHFLPVQTLPTLL